MRAGGLLVAVLAAATLVPAAVARDKVTRTVEVRVVVSGAVTAIYDPEPPPDKTAIGPFGSYAATWSWTQTETTTYRRPRGGAEYADRTVTVTDATLTVTSDVTTRSGPGEGTPRCEESGIPKTAQRRTVDKGQGADIPRRDATYTVVAQHHPTGCGSPDHGANGAFPGHGLESICVWTCTFPAGKRVHSGNVPTSEKHTFAGAHTHSANFTASVTVSTSKPGEKEVRHRWQPDF
jgi:hypothetical protein